MSKYKEIERLSNEDFRRLTGVKRSTFLKMLEILQEAEVKKKSLGGRNNDVCLEDRLLMSLEYLREYRTYFHISKSYGISESTCYRNCRWIENTLIKEGTFSLPGKKELLKSDVEYEVVLIDVTESPIERPKKRNVRVNLAKEDTIPARKNGTLKKRKS